MVAFVHDDTSDVDRIFHSVFVVYFLRIWRQFLKDKNIKKQHFITQPSFEGLEIDLILLVRLIIIGKVDQMPDVCTQHLENFFRKVRSFSPMESMMATCSLKGFMSKVHRIQLEEILLNKFSENFGKKRTEVDLDAHIQTKIADDLIDSTMKKAIDRATEEAAKLGMMCSNIELESFFPLKHVPHDEKVDDNYDHEEDYLDSANDQIDLASMEISSDESVENLNIASIEYLNIPSSMF